MVFMRSKEPCREEIVLEMRNDVEYCRKYGTELAFVQWFKTIVRRALP